MGKRTFLGGSTIVHSGSNWFSGLDQPEPKRRTETDILQQAVRFSQHFADKKEKAASALMKANARVASQTAYKREEARMQRVNKDRRTVQKDGPVFSVTSAFEERRRAFEKFKATAKENSLKRQKKLKPRSDPHGGDGFSPSNS